jgi:hypothetical protein
MNTKFFFRSIKAIAISSMVFGVALLTGCDKKEVENLTSINKELGEKINQLEIREKKQTELCTKLQYSITAKETSIQALNDSIKEKETSIEALNVIISEKDKAASTAQINKQKEEIQFWNDTISQILDIADQMIKYKTANMSSLFIAGGEQAPLDEAEKAQQKYLSFSKEAKTLAYKLPDNESRKELLKIINSIEFNCANRSLWEAYWTVFFCMAGENNKNTKDSKEKYTFYLNKPFDEYLKIKAFKISQ